jgi:hypothetical protein
MEKSFADLYLSAPQNVKDFMLSDDFISFYEEMVKKFEITEDKELDFMYLLQDLVVKLIEPKEQTELTDIIKQRLNFDEEISKQLAYHIWTKFLPFIKKIWEGAEKPKEEETKEELIERIIKKEPEIPKPTPTILNLQKIIPPKKEGPKPIDLKKATEKKDQPAIKTTVSWEPPKPPEEASNIVIIKKKESKESDKNKKVIDLSNF